MKLIQMIRDNIAIQRAYKKRNRKQTSPNAFWWMSRGERRKKNKAILQGDGNRINMFKNVFNICLILFNKL